MLFVYANELLSTSVLTWLLMLSAGKKTRISEEILPTLESQEVNIYGCFPLLPFCEPEDIFPLVVFISSERRQMNLSTSQRFSDFFFWHGDLCDRDYQGPAVTSCPV